MARPKPELVLSDEERRTLTAWASRPKSTQRLALRARIVLACAAEPSNKAVARQLGVCRTTVGTWRSRFVARRLDGLTDEPRPGAPRTVTDEAVEQVCVTSGATIRPGDLLFGRVGRTVLTVRLGCSVPDRPADRTVSANPIARRSSR